MDNTALMRRSWRVNAQAWVDSVRGGLIGSRRHVTDSAIVQAVMNLEPGRVLDLGCGEGWLCRTLNAAGIPAMGVDASPELVDAARRSGGEFYLAAYDELPSLQLDLGVFPVIFCNFSLLDDELYSVLCHMKMFLAQAGALLIQTLHPWNIGVDDYRDGWRVESFAGFEGHFSQPMPWYFRSLASWAAVLTNSGFHIHTLSEPLDQKSGRPLSLLMQCRLTAN